MISQSLTEMVGTRNGASPFESVTPPEGAATSFCKRKESRSRKQVRAVPARRVCKPLAVGGCRACHGADGRLRRAALADPSGHSSAACSLRQRCNTFLANAGVLQVFGVNDIETAELVARSIGKRDAHYMTASHSEGKQTNSEHIAARNLINADEIMRLPDDRMILLRQGHYPAKLRKIRYYEDKEFKACSTGSESDTGARDRTDKAPDEVTGIER